MSKSNAQEILTKENFVENIKNKGISCIDNILFVGNAGTYVGNATLNKAVPHGLNKIPKIVIMCEITNGLVFINLSGTTTQRLDAVSMKTVTEFDTVNFYVGDSVNSANANLQGYYWFVIC